MAKWIIFKIAIVKRWGVQCFIVNGVTLKFNHTFSISWWICEPQGCSVYVQIRVRARRSPSSILIPNSVSRPGDTDQTDTHADLGVRYTNIRSRKNHCYVLNRALKDLSLGTEFRSFNVRSARIQISLRSLITDFGIYLKKPWVVGYI